MFSTCSECGGSGEMFVSSQMYPGKAGGERWRENGGGN